jgi:hypothetical protein
MFKLICEDLIEHYNLQVSPWQNSEWLANETQKRITEREAKAKSMHQIA